MKQTQRHNGIIELVKQQGYVSTEELVEHFSVSPQTIRRDLNELAEQNLILRHHGGAALPSSSVNTPWHDRKATQTEEKERIARKVAEQIPNGSTLFIDIGTTPEAVAHALLNHSNLRIVTNNLNVANTLMVKEDFRIILAGGELRSRDGGQTVSGVVKTMGAISTSSKVIFALIWIVAGWFDLFGMSMANGAHIAGLAVGLAMAFVDSLNARKRK